MSPNVYATVIAIVFYVWHDATKQNPKNQDKEEEDVQ
jgi:hypothetical protein